MPTASRLNTSFGYTALHVLVQILNYFLEKRSRYMRALPFLRATFYLDCVTRVSKNEGICQYSSKFDLELSCRIIHDFCFRDWYVFFCVLWNPVEDLMRAIFIEGDMLSSLSWIVQPVRRGRLDMGSWTVEFSRQRINRDWDLVTRFCNILHENSRPNVIDGERGRR
jgi:hypothetical protein